MTVLTIEELAGNARPGQAIAGLDLGTKTIGLSMSDLGRRFATPRPVIKREKFTIDAEALLAFADEGKGRSLRHRPADEHGWFGRAARSGDPRLRA